MFGCISACAAPSDPGGDTDADSAYDANNLGMEKAAAALECDYDQNPTPLYKAIEEQSWLHIIEYLQSGKWPDKVFHSTFFKSADPQPPDVQARTWVTKRDVEDADEPAGLITKRDESLDRVFVGGDWSGRIASLGSSRLGASNGKIITGSDTANDEDDDKSRAAAQQRTVIKWSQLPIHAAIRRKAPYKIIEMLLILYPQGVRCTDDQHQLPMHLAVAAGADDALLRLLAERFPDAVRATDAQGRKPIDLEGTPRDDLVRMMAAFLNGTAKALQHRHARAMEDEAAVYKAEIKEKDEELQQAKLLHAEVEAARLEAERDAAAAKLALEACRAKLTKRESDKLAQTIRRQVIKQHKRLQAANQSSVIGTKASNGGHSSVGVGGSIVSGNNAGSSMGRQVDVDRFPKSNVDPDATGSAHQIYYDHSSGSGGNRYSTTTKNNGRANGATEHARKVGSIASLEDILSKDASVEVTPDRKHRTMTLHHHQQYHRRGGNDERHSPVGVHELDEDAHYRHRGGGGGGGEFDRKQHRRKQHDAPTPQIRNGGESVNSNSNGRKRGLFRGKDSGRS